MDQKQKQNEAREVVMYNQKELISFVAEVYDDAILTPSGDLTQDDKDALRSFAQSIKEVREECRNGLKNL